jgi:DNA-binding NtrC family response regulator
MTGVLVVDDEPASAEETAEALVDAGLSACWTSDPNEALARAGDRGIGIVVTDLRMPRVDGGDLIRRMLWLRPELRFIVVTGHAADDVPVEADVVLDRFAKPYDIAELVASVVRAVSAPAAR